MAGLFFASGLNKPLIVFSKGLIGTMLNHQQPLKIGIIDSGIAVNFLRATGTSLAGAAHFSIDWQTKRLITQRYDASDLSAWLAGTQHLDIEDETGHGTAVLSIVQHQLKRPAIYYIAKILDSQMSGSAICLTEAIDWLANECEVDAINMSLGCDNFHWRERVQNAVDKARANQCLLFGAAGDVPTLPSEADGVISVGIAHQPQKLPTRIDWMALAAEIDIFQGGTWTRVPISTSYACPQMLACSFNTTLNSQQAITTNY